MKLSKGFTLAELLITTSMVATLSTIATANWLPVIQSNSLASAVNQVKSIYNLTRSEAIKRDEKVTLYTENNMHKWIVSSYDKSSTIKVININQEGFSIKQIHKYAKSNLSLAIDNLGFTSNQRLEFSYGSENRCLIIYKSGQVKVTFNGC